MSMLEIAILKNQAKKFVWDREKVKTLLNALNLDYTLQDIINYEQAGIIEIRATKTEQKPKQKRNRKKRTDVKSN